jgi:hydrogenase maturation protein HypF
MAAIPADGTMRAVRMCLVGRVQGSGVRPAVARLAHQLALTGGVRNTLEGLTIELEGSESKLNSFRRELPRVLPAGANLKRIDEETIGTLGCTEFSILSDDREGPLATVTPPDIAMCATCRDEIADPQNRRWNFGLTTCAACGPRYTILRRMPYERLETSMAEFPLCQTCLQEYRSGKDRRFHAQTMSCPQCGPYIWAVDQPGRKLGNNEVALQAAAAVLKNGEILALRGVGGYQLLCDATDEAAVQRLRERKGRMAKPFAVLVADTREAEKLAQLDASEADALRDSSNPIVLLRARSNKRIAASVHPGLNTIGILLPTTPLHALLVQMVKRPLVCTSGNLDGEPLAYQILDAEQKLCGIADLWLHHNRPIERPIDDSVVRFVGSNKMTLRLARGLAPLSLELPPGKPTLALGGHLKASAAWSNGKQCVLGPHVGDLDTVATREQWVERLNDWQTLYRFRPLHLAHDLHPDYFTTQWALEQQVSHTACQHHEAHIAAAMVEHGLLEDTVLGVSWDGTGYGHDGSIWGGEFFLVRNALQFERIATFRPFPLYGGDEAVRKPWRVVTAILQQALGVDQFAREDPKVLESLQLGMLTASLKFAPRCTSAGRLFDAAACLILNIAETQFEGQAAMYLEAAADRAAEGAYPLPLARTPMLHLDWRPLFTALWEDRRRGVAPATMAMRFHRTMAEGILRIAAQHPELPLVLSGGVFQNQLLTELVAEGAARLKTPGAIPPNDGGLAAGQLAIAHYRLAVRE